MKNGNNLDAVDINGPKNKNPDLRIGILFTLTTNNHKTKNIKTEGDYTWVL